MNTTATNPETKPQSTGDLDLRILIAACLAQLHEQLPIVRTLVDSHQRGIGFLTVEGRKVMDDLIRSERRDHVKITTRTDPTERQWLSTTVRGSGPVPIPGSVAAYAVIDEVTRLAWRIIHDINRGLRDHGGICLIAHRPGDTDPTIQQLLDRVAMLLPGVTNTTILRGWHEQLEDVAARAARIIDGSNLHTHPRACPHCGLHTLVIHMDGASSDWFIECERDPHTGNYEPCVCTDSYCQCRTTGRHRHTWKYTERKHKGTSWDGLTRAQNHADSEAAEKAANERADQ